MRLDLRHLTLAIFFLPIITVIISFILSVNFDIISFCIPHIDGCTSISRIGRYPPVKFFFKPMMYLSGLLFFLYWRKNFLLLKNIKYSKKLMIFYYFGIVSTIFLFLYIFYLGESSHYRFFRKTGIYIYILFTLLAQLSLSIQYFKLKNFNKEIFNNNFVKLKMYFSFFLLAVGIICFPILIIKIENFPEIKNIISWNYFFLIQFYYLLSFFCLKKSGS